MPGGRKPPIDRALGELVRLRLRSGIERDLSLDEAIHLTSVVSRRHFLRASAVTGAGLLLAACTPGSEPEPPVDLPTPGDGPRIVIVGAGLAGLTAAYRLGQAGVATQVFEARDRIGGRCWSSRDWLGDQVAEHGGEFIDTRHVHIQGIIDELGLQLDDLFEGWNSSWDSFAYVDGKRVTVGEAFAPLQEASVAIANVAKANGSYLPGEASRAAIRFDEMTEAEWVAEATDTSMDSATGRLFTQAQAGWYGLDPDRLSASNLIDYYAVESPGADERYTTHGGNDQVPQGLFGSLPEGSVTLEAELGSVREAPDGTYELRFAGVAGPVVADHLILTVPFNVLKGIDLADAGFSKRKMRAIQELGMGTNAKVLMQFDRAFADFDGWSGSVDRGDDPIWGTWASGYADGGSSADRLGLLTVYSGGRVGASYPASEPHDVASEGVVDTTLAAIDEIVPGISASFSGRAWLDSWVGDPWVGGSYAAFVPGNTTSFTGLMGDPEGNAHFAGEHTSDYSQGYLNGGVESGGRAAAEVLDALGKPYPPGLAKAFREQERYRPIYPWA